MDKVLDAEDAPDAFTKIANHLLLIADVFRGDRDSEDLDRDRTFHMSGELSLEPLDKV